MFPTTEHTIAIFERLAADIPPAAPKVITDALRQALEQVRHNDHLDRDEIEDVVIAFGKKLWPYRRAFDEIIDVYEGRLGEKFFLVRLSLALRQRYTDFTLHGGTWRDLHRGGPAAFFSPEERQLLCIALLDTNRDMRRHAEQAVASVDKKVYAKRVIEFQGILDDIEERLDTLRTMADEEEEHPELVAEIRAAVRAFEYGLCLLGPAHSYDAVCQAEEHFRGRKVEKKMFFSLQK